MNVIINNILSTEKGFTLPHVNEQFVMNQSSLGDHVVSMLQSYEKNNFKKFQHLLKQDQLNESFFPPQRSESCLAPSSSFPACFVYTVNAPQLCSGAQSYYIHCNTSFLLHLYQLNTHMPYW